MSFKSIGRAARLCSACGAALFGMWRIQPALRSDTFSLCWLGSVRYHAVWLVRYGRPLARMDGVLLAANATH